MSTDIDINISSFDTFADYFFDGFIFDWIVQSKINDSLDRVINLDRKVEKLINLLINDIYKLENKLETVKGDIDRLMKE